MKVLVIRAIFPAAQQMFDIHEMGSSLRCYSSTRTQRSWSAQTFSLYSSILLPLILLRLLKRTKMIKWLKRTNSSCSAMSSRLLAFISYDDAWCSKASPRDRYRTPVPTLSEMFGFSILLVNGACLGRCFGDQVTSLSPLWTVRTSLWCV